MILIFPLSVNVANSHFSHKNYLQNANPLSLRAVMRQRRDAIKNNKTDGGNALHKVIVRRLSIRRGPRPLFQELTSARAATTRWICDPGTNERAMGETIR